MRKLLLACALLLFTALNGIGQELTIVSPELPPPYEVSPGTDVTFQWSYNSSEPTAIFTYDQEPELTQFSVNEDWTQHTNWTDNEDGTYHITLTIDEPTWVWGGFESTFIGSWSYTDVYAMQIASGVVINAEDGLLCENDTDTETLTVEDSYDSYQWYKNGSPITGATSATYDAIEAGAFKVEVPLDGEDVFSNTINLEYPQLNFVASLNGAGTQLVLAATPGLDTYQWLSGPDPENLSPISGAESATYTADLEGDTLFYAASGTMAGCQLQTLPRPASLDIFGAPEITVSADTNSFDHVCLDSEVILSTTNNYGNLTWYSEGFEYTSGTNSITVSGSFAEGFYYVDKSPAGWPQVSIASDSVEVDFFELTEPSLTGVNAYDKHCPGEELSITLGDEGYDYTWYMHSSSDYTPDDEIDVAGNTYTFDFDTTTNITVVADFEGCSASNSLYIQSYDELNLPINPDNYSQQYLCTDSTLTLEVPGYAQDDFTDFQWMKMENGEMTAIDGETTPSYTADEPGVYSLQAAAAECMDITLTSSEFTVYDYTARNLSIYTNSQALCMGDETDLIIAGGAQWNNPQWFEGNIEIGSNGYEQMFAPIPGGPTSDTLTVTDFNSYEVKARHESCPNGIKITSNAVEIGPKVNPDITPDPNYGITEYHVAAYDSIPAYIYCNGQPVNLSVPGQYDSYSWYSELYAGDDDYQLGNQIDDASDPSVEVTAEGALWVTAQVDSAGCTGVSDPVLIDTYVFQSPAITSYNNGELCSADDSTLLNISFPGDWETYEWYLDGELLPNSNNDSIYATEPGTYVVTTYPATCPEFGYSSGVGPTITILDAHILENDTVIYALPQEGFYEYQWYLDGEPIPAANPPWVRYKDEMEDGVYTVDVTNPEPCTATSGEYLWESSGIQELNDQTVSLYPNPAGQFIILRGITMGKVDAIRLFDESGRRVPLTWNSHSNTINLSGLNSGLYLMKLSSNGEQARLRLIKR